MFLFYFVIFFIGGLKMPQTFPTAANYGDLPGGHNTPEIWHLRLQDKFLASTVLGQIANRNYEDSIKGQGSKVHIRVQPDVIITDYSRGGDIPYQDLIDSKIELDIDQSALYAFKQDDIDRAQNDINVISGTLLEAAERTKIAIDKNVLGSIFSDIPSANQLSVIIANPGTPAATMKNAIVDGGTLLNNANIPPENRWAVLPPFALAGLSKSDLQRADFTGDAKGIIRTGFQGMVDGTRIFMSNNLSNDGTTWQAIMGTNHFVTFASQFTKAEDIRIPNSMGTYWRGLNVYGFKVVVPTAGVLIPMTNTS